MRSILYRIICAIDLNLMPPFIFIFCLAFDLVNNHSEALEDLISLGFQRILTSGCELTALEGLPVLKQLVEQV